MDDVANDFLNTEDIYLESFKFLNNIDLGADNVPNVQYSPIAIGVEVTAPLSGMKDDYKGYYTTFEHEMEFISKIENYVEKGYEFIHMLYTYRSVSQAIPEIAIDLPHDPTPEDEAEVAARKNEINRKVLDILRPEIGKLKDLMVFILNAVNTFHQCINHLTQREQHKELIPEGIYYSLIKLMDVLLILDQLKDIKTCLQKDFSRYKRVIGSHPSIEIIEELNSLQLFLSNPDPKKSKNYIFLSLRNEVKRINNHETVLIEILDLVNASLDNIFYLTPNEKFRLIRIQPYFMLIIDGEADDKNSLNVFKSSKIKNLSNIQKLFKKNPVIPLYNDMTITLEYILAKSSHWDKNVSDKWGIIGSDNVDPKLAAQYSLNTHWSAIKESYNEFIVRLQLSVNRISKYSFRKVLDDVTVEVSEDVYTMVCEGFQKLSKWNMLIQSMLAWKYTHPVSFEALKESQPKLNENMDGIEYARVLKHNFSPQELSVLVDVISCIKSLSSLLAKNESLFAPYIRFHVHHTIQHLVQGDMVPLLHRVDKRNKPILTTLLKLRTIAADWLDGAENRSDYKEYSRKDGLQVSVAHKPRVVATSTAQLYILRLQINALCSDNSELMRRNSMFGKSDLEKSDIELFTKFYEDSFYFSYLLAFSDTLASVSNISELWYREFFLEMTKCIQFPIEMSLPWIMIEHLINQCNSNKHSEHGHGSDRRHDNMIENIFLILDIYNDAAQMTLYKLNTQYLYDEIEAECNLVVDQLYFLLSDLIYSYYKNLAAGNLLEKSYKYKLEELKSASNGSGGESHHLTMTTQHLESILQQKHIQLLGRSINFNFILGQNINNKIYRDIDFAIKRFESADVRGVIDLKVFLDIVSTTHEYLSKFLSLDDFKLMVNELNESFTPSVFRGRISIHMLSSLVRDVIPNYSYNNYTERFIPSPIALRSVEGTNTYSKAPKQSTVVLAYGNMYHKVYEMQSKLTRGYFGYHHLKAYLSLGITLTDLTMVVDQLVKNMLDKLKDIAEYLEALKDSIPPCKPLAFGFHAIGSYGYYEGKLRTLLSYDDLKPEVFQNFREVGNSLALLKDLSNLLEINAQFDYNFLAPLLGITPASASETSQDTASGPQTPVSPIETIVNHLHAEVSGNSALQNNVVKSMDVFNRLPAMIHRQVENITTLLTNTGGKTNTDSNRTLLKYVILKVEEFMYTESMTSEWAITHNTCNEKPNAAIEIGNAKGFHRLYSALSFLFCMTESDEPGAAEGEEQQVSNEAEFGHGFALAGCLLLHLLGQRPAFELLDFSYYVLKVHHYDEKSEFNAAQVTSGHQGVDPTLLRDTQNFIATAQTQWKLQTELFSFFEAQYQVRESYKKSTVNRAVFHPPAEDEF